MLKTQNGDVNGFLNSANSPDKLTNDHQSEIIMKLLKMQDINNSDVDWSSLYDVKTNLGSDTAKEKDIKNFTEVKMPVTDTLNSNIASEGREPDAPLTVPKPGLATDQTKANKIIDTLKPDGIPSPHTLQDYTKDRQKFLISYLRFNGLHATEGLGGRQPMRMTEVEKRYLDVPVLTDINYIPDELKSKVELLSPRAHYQPGDRIRLRVDLHDQRGRIRTSGGDEVRVWLTSPGQGHSRAAEVTDLVNGSYTAETTLQWTGLTQVRVSLTYPWEFLRLVVALRHDVFTTRWIIAIFKNSNSIREVTPCLPSPSIPGYAGTCNLTTENGNVPWFCGQPVSAGLSCTEMILMGNLPYLSPLPLAGPDAELVNGMNNPTHHLKLVPNNIKVMTFPGPTSGPLPPCWTRPKEESWELPARRGWLKAGAWLPDTCALPPFNAQRVRECMRNTSLLLLGDSNMREMFVVLREVLGLRRGYTEYHVPVLIKIPELNGSMLLAPHASPFNTGSNFGVKTLSVIQALQQLPRHHNYIIVLHYWMHFTFYPLTVFRDRARIAKRAVEDFLRTHPAAKIFLRGPHVVYDNMKKQAQFGDMFGPWFISIVKEEFRDLYDRVWFLDFWPMTIASQNYDMHPPRQTVMEMLKVLFGYACDSF